MRRSIMGLAILGSLWSPAHAEEVPVAGREDPRMRYVAYSPGNVVRLSTAVGATLVVTFAPKEIVTAVAVTDSKDLTAMPRGNFLFFKSRAPLTLQPVVVLTTSDIGVRRYVFEFMTEKMATLGPEQPDLFFGVQFVYPGDLAAARRKASDARSAALAAQLHARQATWELEQAHLALEERARDPLSGPRNWHYVAQGDRTILPLEVFDNGFSTVFRFPGNVRIPSVFVINPDGKEATANYAVKGDLVLVSSVARGWRLRDGQTVLCIWNRAFDAIGDRPLTGTSSPDVLRVLKEAPP